MVVLGLVELGRLGAISVTIFFGQWSFACCSSFVRSAAACWSGEWKKIAERYWLPMSSPCRSLVVGLWLVQKTFSRSS